MSTHSFLYIQFRRYGIQAQNNNKKILISCYKAYIVKRTDVASILESHNKVLSVYIKLLIFLKLLDFCQRIFYDNIRLNCLCLYGAYYLLKKKVMHLLCLTLYGPKYKKKVKYSV